MTLCKVFDPKTDIMPFPLVAGGTPTSPAQTTSTTGTTLPAARINVVHQGCGRLAREKNDVTVVHQGCWRPAAKAH